MGCFLIGVTGKGVSKEGDVLLGSVSDNPYDVRTLLKVVQAPGKLTHIGTELVSTTEHSLTERGYFARLGETTRGINERGLTFTSAMVIEKEKPDVMATPFADITTCMMQECETVADAIALFSSKQAIHPAYSVLLGDANGDLAHIEVGSYGMEIYDRYSADYPGIVLAVNCYLSQSLIHYNAPHTLITNKENNNLVRREQGKALAEHFKGELDVFFLMRILSDHKNKERDPMKNPILEAWGYSICNHGTRKEESYPHENLPWGTVSSEILQPSKRQFWYAYGWPCGQEPEYGDQIFQENSWGRFIPFGFKKEGYEKEVTLLTTPEGEITREGSQQLNNL